MVFIQKISKGVNIVSVSDNAISTLFQWDFFSRIYSQLRLVSRELIDLRLSELLLESLLIDEAVSPVFDQLSLLNSNAFSDLNSQSIVGSSVVFSKILFQSLL